MGSARWNLARSLVHAPVPAPQQVGKLGVGWVRVVCHTCKLQYDADQVEHYRHPTVLHVLKVLDRRQGDWKEWDNEE